jgi:hypothetical protein
MFTLEGALAAAGDNNGCRHLQPCHAFAIGYKQCQEMGQWGAGGKPQPRQRPPPVQRCPPPRQCSWHLWWQHPGVALLAGQTGLKSGCESGTYVAAAAAAAAAVVQPKSGRRRRA